MCVDLMVCLVIPLCFGLQLRLFTYIGLDGGFACGFWVACYSSWYLIKVVFGSLFVAVSRFVGVAYVWCLLVTFDWLWVGYVCCVLFVDLGVWCLLVWWVVKLWCFGMCFV